jgi:hypothetical protein
MDILQSQLVLKTCDLPVNENELGYTNNTNSLFVFKNIKIAKLVGQEVYEKFSIFSLSLKSVSNTSNLELTNATSNDLIVAINVSGLSFLNSGYKSSSQNLSNNASMGFYQFPTSGNVVTPSYKDYANPISVNFQKNSDCDLQIFYENIYDVNSNINTNMVFPDVVFIFQITPVQ